MSSFFTSFTEAVKSTVQGLEASAQQALSGDPVEVYVLGGHRYLSKRILGSGGYATVYLVEPENQPGREFALKRLVVDTETLEMAKREIGLWSAIPRHTNVVPLLHHGFTRNPAGRGEKMVLLLMPLCSGGTLYDGIVSRYQEKRYYTERQVLQMFEDVCSGVAALHSHRPPIIHRDLKVENVLFASRHDTTAMICDFGSATTKVIRPALVREKALIEEEIQASTTIPYRAPECIDFFKEYEITEKMDIWALGCVLYKAMYFEDAFAEGQLAIVNVRPSPPPAAAARHFSPQLQQLYQWLWTEDPSERPDIFQVLVRVSQMLGRDIPIGMLHDKYARLHGATCSSDEYFAHLRDTTSSSPSSASSSSASSSSSTSSSSSSSSARRGVSAASLGLFDSGASPQPQQQPAPARGHQQPSLSLFESPAQSPTQSFFSSTESSPVSFPTSPSPIVAFSSPATSPSPTLTFPSATSPAAAFATPQTNFFSAAPTTDFFAQQPQQQTFDFFSSPAATAPTTTAVAAQTAPATGLSKDYFAQLILHLQQAYRDAFVQTSQLFSGIARDSWALWDSKPRPSLCTKPLSDSLSRVHNLLRARDTLSNARQLSEALSGAHAILLAGAPYVLEKAFADSWNSNFETIAQRLTSATAASSQSLARYSAWLVGKLAFQRKHRDLLGCLAPRSFSQFGASFAERAAVLGDVTRLHTGLNEVATSVVRATETHSCLNPVLVESTALLALSLRLLVSLQAVKSPTDEPSFQTICNTVLQNFTVLRNTVGSCVALSPVARGISGAALFSLTFNLELQSLLVLSEADTPFPPLPELNATPAATPAPATSTFGVPALAPAATPTPSLSFWEMPGGAPATTTAPTRTTATPGIDLLSLNAVGTAPAAPAPMSDEFFSIPTQSQPQPMGWGQMHAFAPPGAQPLLGIHPTMMVPQYPAQGGFMPPQTFQYPH